MTEDQANEIKGSMHWGWVCGEIDNRISNVLIDLKTCEKEDLDRLQEKIKMLEQLKTLPEDVMEREQVDFGTGPSR